MSFQNDSFSNNYLQVFLVTGGWSRPDPTSDAEIQSSTELLPASATSWRYSAALPSRRINLRGATVDNKVIVTGTINMDILIS